MKTEREIRRMYKALEHAATHSPFPMSRDTAQTMCALMMWIFDEGPPEIIGHLDAMRRAAESAARKAAAGAN